MEALLQLKDVKKYFPVSGGLFSRERQYVKAVDGVSLYIRPGETLGLVGESGCGKTTIGKMVLRLIEATDGEIWFDGADLRGMSKRELLKKRRDIQIVFQNPYGSLNPRMTAGQLIGEPIRKHRVLPKSGVPARVDELLEIVGLNKSAAPKYPHEFSGGQRQRIVVARALALNPKLIVCDEPVSALDVSIQAQVLNLLQDLQKQFGIAYLFIAHGMAVVQHISHRIGVMYLGKLVEVAQADKLFGDCRHPYTQALMSAVPVPDPNFISNRIMLQGEVPSPINPPAGCRFHPRCPMATERCRAEEPGLRELEPEHFVSCHNA